MKRRRLSADELREKQKSRTITSVVKRLLGNTVDARRLVREYPELADYLPIREDGSYDRVSVRRILATRLLQLAISGNLQALGMLLDRTEGRVTEQVQVDAGPGLLTVETFRAALTAGLRAGDPEPLVLDLPSEPIESPVSDPEQVF